MPLHRREGSTRHSARTGQTQSASSETAREINRDIVLEAIRSTQPVARVDLTRLTGLQPSTVSAIVDQLVQENWIVEGGTAKRARGRRPTLLSMNGDLLTLAVDIHPERAVLAVVDLNGRFLAQDYITIPADAQRATAEIITSLKQLRAQFDRNSFEGIGISIPGRVDPGTQLLMVAPNLGWAPFDVRAEIQKALELTVEIENDCNACLVAELWSGRLTGVRDAVLVAVAEGVGTGILTNGQMVLGHRGLAGEFGHVTLEPNGPPCNCGRLGCWEVFASSRTALHRFSELSPERGAISMHRLLSLAADNDPAAVEAVQHQAKGIGRGLRMVLSALAPEIVLFAGELTGAWQHVEPILRRELSLPPQFGYQPELLVTRDPGNARLRGAAALVLQRHSRFHASTQLVSQRRPAVLPASSQAAPRAILQS